MEQLSPGDPARIGEYRLLGRLGEGGMGTVFLARTGSGRRVAVKLLKPGLAGDAEFRARFGREVAAARQVGGPHTARVVDADAEADPPWLATEYIDGESLQRRVRRDGPLGVDALRELAAGVAAGLAAIHGAGLVHRDLKPANVIMSADGPRIIDFGIARAVDSSTLTAVGTVVGTYAYMAPEQIRADRADPAADVFALGCVLVYAATGASPFDASTVPAIMHRVLTEEPELGRVPDGLREVVAGCLAKEAEDRPSVGELLERLAPVEQLSEREAPAAGVDSAAADSPTPWVAPGGLDIAAEAGPPPGELDAAVAGPPALADGTRIAAAPNDHTSVWPGGETVAEAPPPVRRRISRRTVLFGGLTAAGAVAIPVVALWPEPSTSTDDKGTDEPADKLTTKGGSQRRIPAVEFSRNGKTLAGYLNDVGSGHVQLWDVHSGKSTAVLDIGDTSTMHALALHPDGESFAVGDKTAQLWSIDAGTQTATFEVDFRTFALDFSPDGETLAIGDSGGVTLRDVATGDQVAEFGGRADFVAYSPDGKLIAVVAAGSGGRAGGVWRIADGERLCTLPAVVVPWNCGIAFGPGGETVVIADSIPETSGTGLVVVDATSGDIRFTDPTPTTSATYHPDGSILVTGGEAGAVARKADTGEVVETIADGQCDVVAFSPDGKLLALVMAETSGEVTLRAYP